MTWRGAAVGQHQGHKGHRRGQLESGDTAMAQFASDRCSDKLRPLCGLFDDLNDQRVSHIF